jgi:hypothetical protein
MEPQIALYTSFEAFLGTAAQGARRLSAKPLPPRSIVVIGCYLRDTDETPRLCLACQTESASLVIFEPISDLAPRQLECIHGTRCAACGDVRLYQLLKDGTTDAEIRSELDILAGILTEACLQDEYRGRH